jgi:hypothetical protein
MYITIWKYRKWNKIWECEVGSGTYGETGKETIKYEGLNSLLEYLFKNIFDKNVYLNHMGIIIVFNNLG